MSARTAQQFAIMSGFLLLAAVVMVLIAATGIPQLAIFALGIFAVSVILGMIAIIAPRR